MDMKINASKIVHYRKEKAWSQQHLADVSGLSLRTVQRIENNGSGSPDSIKAIAMAFELIPGDLMESVPEITASPTSVTKRKKALIAVTCVLASLVLIAPLTLLSETGTTATSDETNAPELRDDSNSTEKALIQQQALNWLSLVDNGDYIAGWQASDALVHSQVTAQQWQEAVSQARSVFGKNQERSIQSLDVMTQLPGLPDGEYAMLVFNSKFENKANSIETLPMSKASGEWKPIGYFIR